MIERILKSTGAVFLVASLSTSANAQYQNLEDLDSDIIAAVSCSGMITGLALNNFYAEVLSESRAKDMLYSAALYQLSVAFEEAGVEHYQQYGNNYSEFETDAIESVLDAIENGGFTWQMQEEVDVCTARMVKEIIPPYPDELQSQDVRDRIEEKVHTRFEKLKEIFEAMQ